MDNQESRTNEERSSAIIPQPKRKRETLIKPQSSGIVERAVVVGSGLAIAHTFYLTIPIAAIAALGALGLYFFREVETFQSPKKAKAIEEILHSSLNISLSGNLGMFLRHNSQLTQ